MQGEKKAVILIISFFVAYCLFGAANLHFFGIVNNTQDFKYHWERINGIDITPGYPKAYHFLFSVFNSSQFLFYAANVFLAMVLIPTALYFVKKNWWITAIYFFGIPLPHMILYGATYPQAMVLLYFVVYLNLRKNWGALAILTGLAYFTHGFGLLLFAAIWGIELADSLKEKIIRSYPVMFLGPTQLRGPRGLIEFAFFQLPLPLIYFWAKNANGFFNQALVIGSIAMARLDIRALAIAQLLVAIGAGETMNKENKKVKAGAICLLASYFVFFVLNYVVGTIEQLISGLQI